MTRFSRFPSFLKAFGCLAALSIALPATAQNDEGGWKMLGATSVQVDNYDVTGNKAASPYRHEGTFWQARLGLNLNYDNLVGRVAKVLVDVRAADDDYLVDDGFDLERLTAELEDGGVGLPYRLKAGDVFVSFSRRTIQRSIKGLSLELQPQSTSNAGHSLIFISGTGSMEWRLVFDGEASDLYFNGASYLYQTPTGSSFITANVLHSSQTLGHNVIGMTEYDNDQLLGSIAAETRLGSFLFEGEFAYLSYDDSRADEENDSAIFAQLTYNKRPFWWRLRYEDNGANFIPIGGVGVISDRRFGEFQGRYAINGKGQIGVRAQHIEDQFDSSFPETETTTVGLSFQGRPFARRSSLNVNFSWDANDISTQDNSRDTELHHYRLKISDHLGRGYSLNYSAAFRDQADNIFTAAGSEALDQSLQLGKILTLGPSRSPFNINLRCGVIYRHQWQSNGYSSWSPLIDFMLHRTNHRLALHLSFLDQDFTVLTTEDLRYHTRRLSYTYTRGNHELVLQIGQQLRRPDSSLKTDSQKASLIYRYRFTTG